MLDKGDLWKYLIYAAGEVFLLVIGILIALQINNWNEERKARNLEQYILSEMLINHKNDLQAFEAYIKGNLARQQSQIIISNLYENEYSFVKDLEIEYDRRFQSNHLYEVVLEEINTIKMWERAQPRDIKSLLNHHKFKESLRVSIFNRGLMINTYKGMKSRIERLMENIENELSE